MENNKGSSELFSSYLEKNKAETPIFKVVIFSLLFALFIAGVATVAEMFFKIGGIVFLGGVALGLGLTGQIYYRKSERIAWVAGIIMTVIIIFSLVFFGSGSDHRQFNWEKQHSKLTAEEKSSLKMDWINGKEYLVQKRMGIRFAKPPGIYVEKQLPGKEQLKNIHKAFLFCKQPEDGTRFILGYFKKKGKMNDYGFLMEKDELVRGLTDNLARQNIELNPQKETQHLKESIKHVSTHLILKGNYHLRIHLWGKQTDIREHLLVMFIGSSFDENQFRNMREALKILE